MKSLRNRVPSARDMSDDYEDAVDVSFGEWLRERRLKKGLSLDFSSFNSGIPSSRIQALEKGEATKGITKTEAEDLAKVYGIDPRAIFKRAIEG